MLAHESSKPSFLRSWCIHFTQCIKHHLKFHSIPVKWILQMPQAVQKFVHVVCHLLLVAPARGQLELPAKQACHKSHQACSLVCGDPLPSKT